MISGKLTQGFLLPLKFGGGKVTHGATLHVNIDHLAAVCQAADTTAQQREMRCATGGGILVKRAALNVAGL